MPHPPLAEALRSGAAAIVLLLALLFWRDQRRARGALASAALLAGLLCHVLVPMLLARGSGLPGELVLLGALAAPFLFWIASRIHFEDEYRPLPAELLALGALFALRPLARLARLGALPLGAQALDALDAVAAAAAVLVLLDALRRIHAGARGDLVLPRLRLRRAVLATGGAYGAVVIVGERFLQGSRFEPLAATADAAVLLAGTLAVALLALRAEPSLLPSRPPAREALAGAEALRLRLVQLVRVERVYRQPNLTIGVLAQRLDGHEYRVRQLINSELGHRNFNAFLNALRVEEARATLADPESRARSVAEIAFSLGYASLGPFNRAFREITGQTPTEYRRSQLG